MQKFTKFALSLVLAFFAIAANADNVLVNYEGTATLPEGILLPEGVVISGTTAVKNVKINANTKGVDCIQLANGYNASGKYNENAIILSTMGGFKAGDVLSITGFFNNDDDTKVSKAEIFTVDEENNCTAVWTSEQFINGKKVADDPTAQTYTLEEDMDKIFIGRNGNTGTNIMALSVTRPDAPEIIVTLVADAEHEYTLNGHNQPTIDLPIEAIKVNGLDQEMGEVTYGIYGQDKTTLASGPLSVNTIGYAEFAPVTLYEGNTYNVVITAGEKTLFEQNVIGAAEPEVREISATIFAGEDEITLDTHTAKSAYMIKSIEATFDGFAPRQAGYSINTMKLVEGEESSSWEIDETIADGTLSINGKGYAELDELITLYAGTKYALIINADNESATFEINGAYFDSELVVSLLGEEEKEYTLNGHSVVTVDQPVSAIKVSGLDQEMGEVSYAIYGMNKTTLASGVLSVNTIGYAEFAPITLYEGNQYNVVITAGSETIFDQAVIGAAEPEAREISAVIIAGEEEIALNSHSSVSAEMIKSIEVTFDGFAPQQAGYSLNTMKLVEGEESSSWEIDETIAQGALSLNGKGYAEFEEAITLNAETKYALIINADNESATFQIDGAYAEPMIVTTSLTLGNEENALNAHSSVSIDSADGIKVQVENEPSAIGAIYAINAMKAVESEEGTTWVADESSDIAVGEINFNGGTGYVAFEEGTINFEQGNKYQVKVTVIGGNPAEPDQLGDVLYYEINGSYASEMIVTTSLTLGNEENALNAHSSVSIDSADGIKVQVENEPSAIGAIYAINVMKAVETEEGTTWVADESSDIAVGEINFNGGTGYVAFEEGTINFEQGNKYQVKVTVVGGNPAEPDQLGDVLYYEINGSYVDPVTVTTSLMLGEDEIAINDHSSVSVEEADAIKVQVEGAPETIGFTFLVNEMKLVEGEEGSTWAVGKELEAGEGNFNGGTGYAQFNNGAINFFQGHKYQVSVSVMDRDLNEVYIKKYEIDGASPVNTIVAGNYAVSAVVALDPNVPADKVPADFKKYLGDYNTEATLEGDETALVITENAEDALFNGFVVKGDAVAYDATKTITLGGKTFQVRGLDGTENGKLAINYNEAEGYYTMADATIWYNGTCVATVYDIKMTEIPAPVIEVALIADNEEETAYSILEGRDVTVDLPVKGIEVRGIDTIQDDIHYAIYSKTATLAEGILSINTVGYAQFEAPITLESGVKYNVVLTANEETIFDAIVIGAADVAPTVQYWNGTELLQDGAEIDLAETKSINVNVALPDGIEASADLVLEGVLVGKDGTNDRIGGWSDFEDGFDVDLSRLTAGNAYQIQITRIAYGEIVGMTEENQPIYEYEFVAEEGSALSTLNFAIKSEAPTLDGTVEVSGTEMKVIFPVGTDLGDNYAVKPYILDAENQQIDVADYVIDNTTGEFLDPLNLIVITLTDQLADGQYTLVLPEGMFIVNRGDNNKEIQLAFTIKGGMTTGINSVAADKAANGVMYNVAGQKVNAAKGIVIMNGKKFMVK